MGKQINFYMDAATEQALIDEVLEHGQIVCESEEVTAEPIVVTISSELSRCSGDSDLYLCQPNFGDLVFNTLPDGRMYVDTTKSPVIEFARTGIDDEDRKVYRGRLWVKMKYWDDDGNIIEKPKELEEWYSSLARWVRKHLEKVNGIAQGVYWSPPIRELVNQGYDLM